MNNSIDGMPVLDMLMLTVCAGACALATRETKSKAKIKIATLVLDIVDLRHPSLIVFSRKRARIEREISELGTVMSTKSQ